MYIQELYLKNFRGFSEKRLSLNNRFNVVAGENGSGKTAILEGLCVALGGWLFSFDGLDSNDKRNIYKGDIRTIRAKVSSSLLQQVPVEVSCKAVVYQKSVEWSRTVSKRGGHTTYGKLNQINEISKNINDKIFSADDADILLPIVVYYSAGRLWNEPVYHSKKFKKEDIRLAGYKKALSFTNSIDNTMSYIDKLAHINNDEFKTILAALQLGLNSISPNSKIEYDIQSAELCVIDHNNIAIQFSMLSDGYRCIISLVADIAYRMSLLNPQLKEKAIESTEGVVLIDELDLHLHPKWQRLVVNDLKRIFPNVQFIVTTHSPFIIQSLEEGELISLNNDIDTDYSGESIEDITESIMGVNLPQYSKHKKDMYEAAYKYFESLSKANNTQEVEQLKQDLDLLSAKYGSNVAYYAFIEQKYYAKKAELEKNNATRK